MWQAYSVIEKLEKLTTKRLIAVALNLYYPHPVRLSVVVDFVRSIKNYNPGAIARATKEMNIGGRVKRADWGKYTLTLSGLKYVRWMWVNGIIPDEVVNPAIHSVRVKQKVVRPDGTVDYVYL